MKLSHVLMLPFSSREHWQVVRSTSSTPLLLALLLTMPLSLIPPVMLHYAGTQYGNVFIPGFADKPWFVISIIFFFAEWATFLLMGWLIHNICTTYQKQISYQDAYLLSIIAPIPMWLSGLGLFIPNLMAVASIAIAGLILSCIIVYRGLRGLALIDEDVEAMAFVQTILGACVIAWLLLLMTIVSV